MIPSLAKSNLPENKILVKIYLTKQVAFHPQYSVNTQYQISLRLKKVVQYDSGMRQGACGNKDRSTASVQYFRLDYSEIYGTVKLSNK